MRVMVDVVESLSVRLSLFRFLGKENILDDRFGSCGIIRLTKDFWGVLSKLDLVELIGSLPAWLEKRSNILEMRRIDGLLVDIISTDSSSDAVTGNVGWKHRLDGG